MAIGLVSLAKHTVDSVFSLQTKDLDRVLLLVDDLCQLLIDRNFCSNGDVAVVEGERVESGVHTSLLSGLEKIFVQYNMSSDVV